MRVVWFDNAIEWGGVQVHLAFLAEQASACGVEGRIICENRLLARYREVLAGVPVELVGIDCHDLSSVTAWIEVHRAIKAFRADVVHAHLYWAMRMAAPLARLAGVRKVVETVHLEEGWRTGWRRLFSWGDGLLGRFLVDRHIAVSRSVARSLVAVRGVRPGKIDTIHNAVPLERSSGGACRRPGRFAFLGRLERQKGLDVLLLALGILKYRRMEFHLAVGGEGSLRTELERIASELDLSDRVTFVGRVTDRSRFFEDRSVLVLPSRFEGFPLVLLEAASHGQCVVASDVSGIPEIVDDGATGLLVPKEDPIALADALERLLRDDGLRSRLAQGLARTVENEYSPRRFVERTLEVLA